MLKINCLVRPTVVRIVQDIELLFSACRVFGKLTDNFFRLCKTHQAWRRQRKPKAKPRRNQS